MSQRGLKVAVIGAAGRMGRWFTNYFIRKGASVTVYDVRSSEALKLSESQGVTFASHLRESVKEKDLVLVAVPIDVMPEMLRKTAQHLEEGAILMEIASLKTGVTKVLKEIAHLRITPISIHPLIGPGASGLSRSKITFTPVVDREREGRIVADTFPDAIVEELSAEEHDRAMAIVLSITHFTSLVFASVVAHEDIAALRKLGGTSFPAQLALTEGLLCGSPDMFASIQLENPYCTRYVQEFVSNAAEFLKIVKENRREELLQAINHIQKGLSKDSGYALAHEYIYQMINALTPQ